jgi:hypothetical protein
MSDTVKHVIKEGSRQHVLSWHGGIVNGRSVAWTRCSEPNCEINKIAPKEAWRRVR